MLNSVHLLLNLVFDSHFRVFMFFSVLGNMNSMLFLAKKNRFSYDYIMYGTETY